MTLATLPEHHKSFMAGNILACPMRGHATSFQLVDEFGAGEPYAGLTYEVTDYEDIVYTGRLDATGFGKVDNHYCGVLMLKLSQPYKGSEKVYTVLTGRSHYPLAISELQVRAEKTQLFNTTGARTQNNRAQNPLDVYYQVEVSELVEHVAHLPPVYPDSERTFPPDHHVLSMFRQQTSAAMSELGFGVKLAKRFGTGLLPNRHHVLEVRPLRAFRPLLSTDNDFCALNLYQLSLMATLSYSPFGQQPEGQPVFSEGVGFTKQPSSGNWFGDVLAKGREIWQVDADQQSGMPYYPLFEEVPYSKRLEIVPFDPQQYPLVNDPALGAQQENPANIHFFDDAGKERHCTDSQAFITHNDEQILIAIRGTSEMPWDLLRDMNALQVPVDEGDGVGQAHQGFYQAAQAVRGFVARYLDKFYSGQKVIITGHSLGGAIALLLAEMLRRREGFNYDILLYTYGAPRAADQTFVDGAKALVHHRMVNHNDPIPGVPGTGMDAKPLVMGAGLVVSFINAPLGIAFFALGVSNLSGAPYAHHGELHHFMPVTFDNALQSSILWKPECLSITDHAYEYVLQQNNGLPTGRAFEPAFYVLDHLMIGSYIPNSWATLRRWQESLEMNRPLVTEREIDWINKGLLSMDLELSREEDKLRPDAHKTVNKSQRDSLKAEINKMRSTATRLHELGVKKATGQKVYGNVASRPESLTLALERWKAHAHNTVAEQLAMAPPAPFDPVQASIDDDNAIAVLISGYDFNAAFDIDSFIKNC